MITEPFCIFLTTAHPEALDYETRNRFVMLTADESNEQTKRILEQQRWNETLEGLVAKKKRDPVIRRHRNAQRLIEPLHVVNPHAPSLSFPSAASHPPSRTEEVPHAHQSDRSAPSAPKAA